MGVMVEGAVGAKCCAELRDVYCGLGRLKKVIDDMRNSYVNDAAEPSFRSIEEAYLLVGELYADLERYVLPVLGEDSVYRTPGSDEPLCPV